MRGAHQISDGFRVESTTFFKPVYDEIGDYDVDSMSRLNAILTERLAFTVSCLYHLDSTPAAGVGREDQVLTAGLTIQL